MKLRFLQYVLLVATLLFSATINAQDCQDNWLSVDGNKLVDINGNEVKLTGTNWSGFEATISVLEGLYNRDILAMLAQIKDLGFNHIRVPWHNGILAEDFPSVGGSINTYGMRPGEDKYNTSVPPNSWGPFTNLFFEGKSDVHPLEVLDYMVEWCQDNDMRIVLDNHSREPNGYLTEELWYTDSVPHEKWIEDWVFMANRYKDYPAVVAMDLNNEPHGNPEDYDSYAAWGTGDIANDWRLAVEDCGNAILEVNPNVIIMVEGIEQYITPEGEETNYWWGGNLQGARDYPVRLSDPSKLMYSPHEYGPTVFEQDWFLEPSFPNNMAEIWETQFNFLNTNGTSPLYVGELGIRDQDSTLDLIWFETFTQYIKDQNLHWSYWTFNPNSGDTGGVLTGDWYTVHEWKMDYLKPILADPIPNCIVYTGTNLSNEEFNVEVIDFRVYPNPTTDLVTFSTSSNNIKSIEMFDSLGKQVLVASGNSFELDLSSLSTGIYFAKVISQKGVSATVKVVKE